MLGHCHGTPHGPQFGKSVLSLAIVVFCGGSSVLVSALSLSAVQRYQPPQIDASRGELTGVERRGETKADGALSGSGTAPSCKPTKAPSEMLTLGHSSDRTSNVWPSGPCARDQNTSRRPPRFPRGGTKLRPLDAHHTGAYSGGFSNSPAKPGLAYQWAGKAGIGPFQGQPLRI